MKKNIEIELPFFFKSIITNNLFRCGKKNDGGYIVSKNDIDKTDILLSLGMNDDWSFETDFIKKKDVPVLIYDGLVDYKFWLKKIFIETIKNPFNFYFLKKLISYKYFFNKKRRLIKKFVGFNSNRDNFCTLSSIINSLKHHNIFIKIDIEGDEYRLLETLILNQDKFTGLVIEFHDCDIHIKKIENFIKNFNLRLINVHGNNFAPINLDKGLPLVLELSFSNHSITDNLAIQNTSLETANNPNDIDISISVKS